MKVNRQKLAALTLALASCWFAPSAVAQTSGESVQDILAERLALWQVGGRDDRVQLTLEQLRRSNPDHPMVLEALAQLALQRSDLNAFNEIVERLQQVAPDSRVTARLAELARLDPGQRQLLAQARLLSLSGRNQQAYDIYQEVFSEPPVNPELALDYWRSISVIGEHDRAITGLRKLYAQNPGQVRIELELYSAQLRADQLNEQAVTRTRSLIKHPVFGPEARQIWLRHISSPRPVTAAQTTALARYLEDYPNDAEAMSMQRMLQSTQAAERAYERKPSTRFMRQAQQALDNNEDEAALQFAKQALQADSSDPQVQGTLAYAQMRNGQQQAALQSFSRARQLDPDTNEWQQMTIVSSFWAKLEQFDEALEDGELAAAEGYLSELNNAPAETIADPQALILAQADLAFARGDYELSRQSYDAVLASDASSEAALWGVYAGLLETASASEVEQWYQSLSSTQQELLSAEFNRREAVRISERVTPETDTETSLSLLRRALELDPGNPWLTYQLTSRQVEQGQADQARERFEELVAASPSADARFAFALLLSQLDEPAQALAQLNQIPADQQTSNTVNLRNQLEISQALANEAELLQLTERWSELEAFPAAQFLDALREQEQTAALSWQQVEEKLAAYPEDLDLLVAASQFADAQGRSEEGFELANRAIAMQRQASATSIWAAAETDDWRTSRLRQQALSYTQANEAVIQVGFDYQDRDATPGVSSLTAETLVIDASLPDEDILGLGAGEWFLRVDPTRIDAGSLDYDNEFIRNRFGTGLLCDDSCPTGLIPQSDQGIAVGVGFRTEQVAADIGWSPVGFEESTLVGGVEYSSDWREFGWSVAFDRRILSSSLLNFAGTRDPRTGEVWGAVTRSGLSVAANWDQGGAWGWWSTAGADYYDGKNVAGNTRLYAYSGVYWRAFDREWFAVDLGLTGLAWTFNDDLSESTFGQGGYYSPQIYASLSVPITIYGRWDRLSYLVRASVGESLTEDDDQVFFPDDAGLQAEATGLIDSTGVDPVFNGARSRGFGRSINAAIEYRVTDHWYIGLTANLQRAELFTPNNGMIYLRYHFGGYALPPRRPPQPPVRYVDF